ncbi:hypothetical protein CICLE_v10010126mg [Citrus x clementina]|uniref:Uncharacterized protein n=1 Tax=Citrus clementina TaxID=85681 RepID=V4TYC0_CITCL|nr:hypothetical protein CICLE_v10010126mg [Citrus x clementina]
MQGRKRNLPSSKNTDNPKSVAFKRAFSSQLVNKKFSGLRSLCITPLQWQTFTTPIITLNTEAAALSL